MGSGFFILNLFLVKPYFCFFFPQKQFPPFFFRKRKVEERKLSHGEIRRQTARSLAKIYKLVCWLKHANFLTLISRQICIGVFLVRTGMQKSSLAEDAGINSD